MLSWFRKKDTTGAKARRNVSTQTLKGGRRSLLELGYTIEGMWEVYKEEGTIDKAAEKLKISERTLRKYLKEGGYKLKRGVRKGSKHPVHHHSCLAKWLREHKGERLPRSIPQIARITGCSHHAVGHYLRRRRERVEKEANELLKKLRDKEAVVYDTYERKLPLKAVKDWSLKVDKFSFNITVNFNLKTPGKVTFLFNLDLLRRQNDNG